MIRFILKKKKCNKYFIFIDLYPFSYRFADIIKIIFFTLCKATTVVVLYNNTYFNIY